MRVSLRLQTVEVIVSYVVACNCAFRHLVHGQMEVMILLHMVAPKYDMSIQLASQDHHLKEFKAIEGTLSSNAVVLIDDCDLPNGGKGKKVVQYMIGKGWVIDVQAYQILLIRDNSL